MFETKQAIHRWKNTTCPTFKILQHKGKKLQIHFHKMETIRPTACDSSEWGRKCIVRLWEPDIESKCWWVDIGSRQWEQTVGEDVGRRRTWQGKRGCAERQHDADCELHSSLCVCNRAGAPCVTTSVSLFPLGGAGRRCLASFTPMSPRRQ